MRPLSVVALALLLSVSSFVKAQTVASSQTLPPQTARQALIEMFFGTAANHLEKHLPEVTRKSLQKLGSANGQSFLSEFSMFASQAKASGTAFQTFETGPTLVSAEDPRDGSGEKVEITMERDDLVGDEDQIIPFHGDFDFFTASVTWIFRTHKGWPGFEGLKCSAARFGLTCKHRELTEEALTVRASEFLKTLPGDLGKMFFQVVRGRAKEHLNQGLPRGLGRQRLRRCYRLCLDKR